MPILSIEHYRGWIIKFSGREWIGMWDDSWTAEHPSKQSFQAHMHPSEGRFKTKEEALLSAMKMARKWIDVEEQEVNLSRPASRRGQA